MRLAVKFAGAHIVRLLLGGGAECDARDDWGRMAIFYAPVSSEVFGMTLLLRFIFGAVLAAGVALWSGIPLTLGVILVVAVGIMAAIWGDKFLLGFMALMRYLR